MAAARPAAGERVEMGECVMEPIRDIGDLALVLDMGERANGDPAPALVSSPLTLTKGEGHITLKQTHSIYMLTYFYIIYIHIYYIACIYIHT